MAVIKAGFRCGCLAPLNKTKFDEESRLKEQIKSNYISNDRLVNNLVQS